MRSVDQSRLLSSTYGVNDHVQSVHQCQEKLPLEDKGDEDQPVEPGRTVTKPKIV